MEASCASDADGTMAGNATEQADAEQAFVQAMFLGTPTSLRLPKQQWPEAWRQQGIRGPCGAYETGAIWPPRFRRTLGAALRETSHRGRIRTYPLMEIMFRPPETSAFLIRLRRRF